MYCPRRKNAANRKSYVKFNNKKNYDKETNEI